MLINGIINNRSRTSAAKLESELTVTDASDTVKLIYTNLSGTLSFEKEDKKWYCLEYPDWPIVQSHISSIISSAENIVAIRALNEYESLEEFGLENPDFSVELIDKNSNSTVVYLGITRSACYAMAEGNDRVFVIGADLISEVVNGIQDIVKYDNFPTVTEKRITSITVEIGGKSYAIVKNRTEYDGESELKEGQEKESISDIIYVIDYEWQIDGVKQSSVNVNNAATAWKYLTYVPFDKCISYVATDDKMQAYGLAEPYATLTMTYMSVDGDIISTKLDIGNVTSDGEYYYAELDDNGSIVITDFDIINQIMNSTSHGAIVDGKHL